MAKQLFCQDKNHVGSSRIHGCYDHGGIFNLCTSCKKEKCIMPDGMIAKTCRACITRANRLSPVKEK